MSNEEDVDDQRQYRYVRKYYKMVKQFDDIIEIMDARTTQLKRRRVSFSPRKSRSTSGAEGSHSTPLAGGSNNSRVAAAARGRSNSKPAARSQLDNNNNVLVQTITRHLEDLKNDNPCPSDSDC